jgi:hypothetical protein
VRAPAGRTKEKTPLPQNSGVFEFGIGAIDKWPTDLVNTGFFKFDIKKYRQKYRHQYVCLLFETVT